MVRAAAGVASANVQHPVADGSQEPRGSGTRCWRGVCFRWSSMVPRVTHQAPVGL